MSVDLLNRALRPSSIAVLLLVGALFLFGLGSIMLYRYAAFGEIDWQGLAAFCSMILLPILQHFQNRHALYKYGRLSADRPLDSPAPSPSGGLVNNQAIA